jgi:hypothetical protein
VISLVAFTALSFEVILLYVTCFTILCIVVIELKSIDFSALTLGMTLDEAVGIDWFIVIASLVMADLLALLIRSSLWSVYSKDEILSKEELVFLLGHLGIRTFAYLVFVLEIICSGQEGLSSIYCDVGELIATPRNASLSNTRAEFAKLLARLYFEYRALVKALNCFKDVCVKVLLTDF